MTKSQIRLQYSGLIIFLSKMLSVITGLAFQLMIARATTEIEYGIWFNMMDLLLYFTLLSTTLPFWALRFSARGEEGSVKTGVLANLIISAIATAVYVPLVPTLTSSLGIEPKYAYLYFVVSAQIMEVYALSMLSECVRARKPQCLGYGLLIEEVAKVALGYFLIIHLRQPLLGALVSLIVACAIQTFYLFKVVEEDLKQKVKWSYVKEWLKGSIANVYGFVGTQIANFILIMLFIYGGEVARSYYGAGAIVANIIPYSLFLAFALYPKLLMEERIEDVTTALRLVLMFAIPMAVGAMAIPDSLVIILKSEYERSATVLFILAINAFIMVLIQFFSSVVLGLERIDEKAKIPLKQLVRSRIFKVSTLPYIQSAITLPTALYALTSFSGDPLRAALYIAMINTLASLIILMVLYATMLKAVKLIIPWRSIAKYALASMVMGITLYAIPHPTKIREVIGAVILSGSIYITLIIIMDREARNLAKAVWSETKAQIKRVFHRS